MALSKPFHINFMLVFELFKAVFASITFSTLILDFLKIIFILVISSFAMN